MKSSAPRLVDDLAGHLRSRLLSGKYQAGEVLPESGIASEYGVARPTARAGIDVLVADGLLVREAHLPAKVTEVGQGDLLEIIQLLEVSERMALARLMLLPSSRRPSMRPATVSAHSLFNGIVLASGSGRLALLHRRTTFEFLLGCEQHGLGNASLIDAQGRATWHSLAEAIAAGDAATAGDKLHELQGTRRAVVEGLVGQPLEPVIPG